MAINLSQLSEEAGVSQPEQNKGSWWSRTLDASKKQAREESEYTPLDYMKRSARDFLISSTGASKDASIAQAQSEKDMGITDYMQKSAEIPFKSLVSVPIRAVTYGENILATGEDILGGKYFGAPIPSWQESAEKRRQEARAQEERTFNLFDFSKSEQETARTAVDFGATAPIGGTLAKGGSLFARTATNATIGAGAMVPFTTLTEGRLPTAGEYAIGGGLGATLGAFGKEAVKGTETGRQITKDFTKPAVPKVEKGVEAEAEKIVGKTVPAQYGKKQVNIAPPTKHWYTAIGDKLAGITPERLINAAFKPTNLGKSAKRILYGVKNLANDTAEYIGMVRTGKLTGEIDDLQGFAQSLVENQDIVGKKIGKAITKLEGQATISEETMGKITNTLAKDYEQATPAYTTLSNVKNLLSKARTYQDLWNIKSIFGKEVENLIKSGGNASESFRVLADVVHELDNIVTNKMSKLKGAEYRGLNRQYALIKRLSLTAAKSANVDMRRAPETLAEQIGVIGRIYSGITSPIATTDKMLAKFVAEANSRGGAYKRFLEITDQKAIDLAKTLKATKKQNLLKPKTTATSEIAPEVNVAYQKNIADKYGKNYGIPEEDITASVKEIQDAYPDAQIRVVDNLSDSEGNSLAGMFDPNTKEILISKEGAMKTTAWHEQAHSSLDSIKSANPERYAKIESEAAKLYGTDWEEHVAEEAFYFMKRGEFKFGNIGTALKEFVVNLVNEMKAVFGKGDAVRKFQSDLTKGKLNNKGGKSLFPEKGEIKKQIAGEKAKNAPPKNYTGWYKGVDGKMKFEIDDTKANFWEGPERILAKEGKYVGELGHFLNHPELFRQYPELKNLNIEIIAKKPDVPELALKNVSTDMSKGQFDGETIKINAYGDENIKSTLLHEIQHAIQDIEGFTKGGSSSDASDILRKEIKRLSDIDAKAYKYNKELLKEHDRLQDEFAFSDNTNAKKNIDEFMKKNGNKITPILDNLNKIRSYQESYSSKSNFDLYKMLAGEVEARNVQKRMNMTMEERLKNMSETTEDVPKSKQIVRK